MFYLSINNSTTVAPRKRKQRKDPNAVATSTPEVNGKVDESVRKNVRERRRRPRNVDEQKTGNRRNPRKPSNLVRPGVDQLENEKLAQVS
jgi:hypothetical protein